MKVEDIEKLKKGQCILDNIGSYNSCIEDLEQRLQESEKVEGGVLYTEGEDDSKIRLRLSKELAVKVMGEVLGEYKAKVAELKKEFDEL